MHSMANTFLSFKVWVGKNNLKKQKKKQQDLKWAAKFEETSLLMVLYKGKVCQSDGQCLEFKIHKPLKMSNFSSPALCPAVTVHHQFCLYASITTSHSFASITT